MSLRIFHIVFITVSVLLSAFVGVWGLRMFVDSRSIGALSLGIVFVIFGALLIEYGRRTFRKLKELP
jgi:hypothetical protein